MAPPSCVGPSRGIMRAGGPEHGSNRAVWGFDEVERDCADSSVMKRSDERGVVVEVGSA